MQPNQAPNPNELPAQPLAVPEQPGRPTGEKPAAPAAPEKASASVPSASPVPPTLDPTVLLPPLPAAPATTPPSADPATSATPPNANPQVAEDVDVIEKAWVDQADTIVKQTQEDPYVEEEAVEALQQDYLKKRYGHDVSKPDSG
jgi:hypothetical protein